jgi:agmatine deiminase
VLEHLGVPRYEAPIVLEGGAIHVDGEGTCLVCTPSVLDPKRNPGLDRGAIERVLGDFLGVDKVIWLPHGLVDDETGGHVDNVACFAGPGRVLALVRDEPGDPDQEGLAANLAVLREAVDAKGRRLEVVPIAAPRPRPRDRERRLSLSYVNLYVANGGVVMPAFHDPADRPALRAVEAAFPDREVVQIEVSDLLWGGGGIHCITQQEPDPGPG